MAVPYIPGAMVDVTCQTWPLGEDEYGNEVLDTSGAPASAVVIEDCCFQPENGREDVQDGDRFEVRGVVYMPLDPVVSGLNTLVIPGWGSFKIDGPVDRWPDVGGLGHQFARVHRFKE